MRIMSWVCTHHSFCAKSLEWMQIVRLFAHAPTHDLNSTFIRVCKCPSCNRQCANPKPHMPCSVSIRTSRDTFSPCSGVIGGRVQNTNCLFLDKVFAESLTTMPILHQCPSWLKGVSTARLLQASHSQHCVIGYSSDHTRTGSCSCSCADSSGNG